MSSMSDYLEDQLVTHIFRTGTFTKPTVLAVALLTTVADDDDTGQFSTSTGVEVSDSGTAYARISRNPLDANWTASTGGDGQTDNVAEILFALATASWGTLNGMGIADSATYDAGNLLFHGALTTPKAIDTDEQPRFAIGALTVTFA
jgi:hypothetical protein